MGLFIIRILMGKGRGRPSVLLALFDALSEQILNLPIYRAEIFLSPGRQIRIQFGIQAQRYLFFCSLRHISTGSRS